MTTGEPHTDTHIQERPLSYFMLIDITQNASVLGSTISLAQHLFFYFLSIQLKTKLCYARLPELECVSQCAVNCIDKSNKHEDSIAIHNAMAWLCRNNLFHTDGIFHAGILDENERRENDEHNVYLRLASLRITHEYVHVCVAVWSSTFKSSSWHGLGVYRRRKQQSFRMKNTSCNCKLTTPRLLKFPPTIVSRRRIIIESVRQCQTTISQ